jgi:hypothetical protein
MKNFNVLNETLNTMNDVRNTHWNFMNRNVAKSWPETKIMEPKTEETEDTTVIELTEDEKILKFWQAQFCRSIDAMIRSRLYAKTSKRV